MIFDFALDCQWLQPTVIYLVLLDIEVMAYYDDNKLNEYDAMAPDDRRDIPLDGVLKLASICRQVRRLSSSNFYLEKNL